MAANDPDDSDMAEAVTLLRQMRSRHLRAVEELARALDAINAAIKALEEE